MNPIPPSSRPALVELIEQGAVPAEHIPAALTLTGVHPPLNDWRRFIDTLLLWLGGLAMGFALLFFIAYNWADMGRFAKFALVQLFMVASLAVYWRWQAHPVIGKIALLVTCIGLGVLLALFGQTYQTGADPWQLFFHWAVLMLPWVVIARFAALWIVWLALINLAAMLYYQTFGSLWRFILLSEVELFWLLLAINAAALVSGEALRNKFHWLNESWTFRLIAVGCGVPATLLALYSIVGKDIGIGAGLVWIVFFAGLIFFYRNIRPDLFMLAGACLSGIVVTVAFVADFLLRDGDEAGSLLLLALLIIGLSSAAAIWLRNVNRELQQ